MQDMKCNLHANFLEIEFLVNPPCCPKPHAVSLLSVVQILPPDKPPHEIFIGNVCGGEFPCNVTWLVGPCARYVARANTTHDGCQEYMPMYFNTPICSWSRPH